MAGFVFDIIIDFLVRSFVRCFRFFRSMRWNRGTASIIEAAVSDPAFGCPVVKVSYKAIVDGGDEEGKEEIPFCFSGSASEYAQKVSGYRSVVIRVNPRNSTNIRFFDSDQL